MASSTLTLPNQLCLMQMMQHRHHTKMHQLLHDNLLVTAKIG